MSTDGQDRGLKRDLSLTDAYRFQTIDTIVTAIQDLIVSAGNFDPGQNSQSGRNDQRCEQPQQSGRASREI
jgi:hypothetical protein